MSMLRLYRWTHDTVVYVCVCVCVWAGECVINGKRGAKKGHWTHDTKAFLEVGLVVGSTWVSDYPPPFVSAMITIMSFFW